MKEARLAPATLPLSFWKVGYGHLSGKCEWECLDKFFDVWIAILVSNAVLFSKVALIGSEKARVHVLMGIALHILCILTRPLFTC